MSSSEGKVLSAPFLNTISTVSFCTYGMSNIILLQQKNLQKNEMFQGNIEKKQRK